MLMDLLFEGIIKSLETVGDVIEYGPGKAFEINTSVCPEAERAAIRINRELEKGLDNSTVYDGELKPEKESASIKVFNIYGGDAVQSTKYDYEKGVDETEEEIIHKAVMEKGHW